MEKYITIHNEPKHRFEIKAKGHTAILSYELFEGSIDFNHTLVPPALEGKGVGSSLVRSALDYVISHHIPKVIPSCPFVRAFFTRHPEYQYLL